MPRRRTPDSGPMVYRTARVGLRVTRAQRERCYGLLRSAGDVWACRELVSAGPGTFGELDAVGARSVLRRYSDAWFSAAKRRNAGELDVRFPRRRRHLLPLRWYHGTFTLDGRRLRLPAAAGCAPLWLRLDRDLPYPAEQVRSVTLLNVGSRLFVEVTAEIPIAMYRAGLALDAGRGAGVDLGIIHPYAVAGPDGGALLVSGRAIRAEHRMHLADTKTRRKATAGRAPKPGQRGSRRWRKTRRRALQVEGRHRRRIHQTQHEAARMVVNWAVANRVGTLTVGDPRGVLNHDAGRRHNLRVRQWQIGRAIAVLTDKATVAGITVYLVDERGTSSTCPACRRKIPKPKGRVLSCPHCQFSGHRDLSAAATIATRTPGGGLTTPELPEVVTHRRAGRHLPGAGRSRRDPRRPQPRREGRLAGCGPPQQNLVGSRSPAPAARIHNTNLQGKR